jgi:YHS domain-containing protein
MKVLQFTLVVLLLSVKTFAQTVSYYTTAGTAIKGYDPVAYFTEQKAVAGKPDFSFEWSGSKWLFSSQANLERFKTDPQKYVPQYGGYCAYGVSDNHKSPTDPNAWTIVGDKLYLNYSLKVKELWSKDIPNRIHKADELWPTVSKQ